MPHQPWGLQSPVFLSYMKLEFIFCNSHFLSSLPKKYHSCTRLLILPINTKKYKQIYLGCQWKLYPNRHTGNNPRFRERTWTGLCRTLIQKAALSNVLKKERRDGLKKKKKKVKKEVGYSKQCNLQIFFCFYSVIIRTTGPDRQTL